MDTASIANVALHIEAGSAGMTEAMTLKSSGRHIYNSNTREHINVPFLGIGGVAEGSWGGT